MEVIRNDRIEVNNLFRMSSLLHRVIDSHFKHQKFDRITIRQIRIIEEVFYVGDRGIRLKDLAGRLGITSSAASQMVESLVKSEILERVTSDADRREILITVSKSIRECYAREKEYLESMLAELLDDTSQDEIASFSSVAGKIVQRLGAKLNLN